MRNADHETRPADTAWKQAGPGQFVTFKCSRCGNVGSTAGRKQDKRRGLVFGWLCRGCA